MTPLQINILVHYYCYASDFRDGDFSAPAVREAMDSFKDSAFLKLSNGEDIRSIYEATEKCTIYVEALCAVPEPVQVWQIPVAPTGQDHGVGEIT